MIKIQISYISYCLFKNKLQFNFFRRYFFKSATQIIKCKTALNKMNCH